MPHSCLSQCGNFLRPIFILTRMFSNLCPVSKQFLNTIFFYGCWPLHNAVGTYVRPIGLLLDCSVVYLAILTLRPFTVRNSFNEQTCLHGQTIGRAHIRSSIQRSPAKASSLAGRTRAPSPVKVRVT
jgi:hypothetical protein